MFIKLFYPYPLTIISIVFIILAQIYILNCCASQYRFIKAIRGYKDKKKIIFQNEKKKIFKYHNSDIHIYFDNKFVAIIECKAYLDSCYFTRACSDFRLFKKFNYKLKNIILSLENSINTDSVEFINYSYGNVCHKIFYLLNGKISASKPIYDKKYDKKIDASATLSAEATEYEKKNKKFITFIYEFINSLAILK